MHSLYRRVGERNGRRRSIRSAFARARSTASGCRAPRATWRYLLSQGTSREAEATARELGRLPYSRSSFERVGHAVGETYVAQHQHVEQLAHRRRTGCRARLASVSASLDRVTPADGGAAPAAAGRPRKGAPKKPIERVYRMAYCGTVTLHDAEGNAIHTIRYGTMPEGDAARALRGAGRATCSPSGASAAVCPSRS